MVGPSTHMRLKSRQSEVAGTNARILSAQVRSLVGPQFHSLLVVGLYDYPFVKDAVKPGMLTEQ